MVRLKIFVAMGIAKDWLRPGGAVLRWSGEGGGRLPAEPGGSQALSPGCGGGAFKGNNVGQPRYERRSHMHSEGHSACAPSQGAPKSAGRLYAEGWDTRRTTPTPDALATPLSPRLLYSEGAAPTEKRGRGSERKEVSIPRPSKMQGKRAGCRS